MAVARETVILEGHIIDSLLLPKVLDAILALGGNFDLPEVKVGTTRDSPSHARIEVRAPSKEALSSILQAIQVHGARVEKETDAKLEVAPRDGVLPEAFYATSHLPTQIRLGGQWIDVEAIEMDLAIVVGPGKKGARATPMGDVKKGDLVVTGRRGVRVTPLEGPRERDVFSFMESQVSGERPHTHAIIDVARRMQTLKDVRDRGGEGGKVLFVGGPAIIHGGGREALAWLINSGFIQVLFCGNALASHDLEVEFFGTSLGYRIAAGRPVPHGHEHHLRAINRIRNVGGIEEAVRAGLVKDGIMAACVRQGVRLVMAGSIRDDGPLPGVITDSMEAQRAMRAALAGVELALLVATTLHAIATGNLLPAGVATVCVDLNPAVPTKLADRGTFQATGLVMDSASFLRELARRLGWTE